MLLDFNEDDDDQNSGMGKITFQAIYYSTARKFKGDFLIVWIFNVHFKSILVWYSVYKLKPTYIRGIVSFAIL